MVSNNQGPGQVTMALSAFFSSTPKMPQPSRLHFIRVIGAKMGQSALSFPSKKLSVHVGFAIITFPGVVISQNFISQFQCQLPKPKSAPNFQQSPLGLCCTFSVGFGCCYLFFGSSTSISFLAILFFALLGSITVAT